MKGICCCWIDGVERFASGYRCFDSQEQEQFKKRQKSWSRSTHLFNTVMKWRLGTISEQSIGPPRRLLTWGGADEISVNYIHYIHPWKRRHCNDTDQHTFNRSHRITFQTSWSSSLGWQGWHRWVSTYTGLVWCWWIDGRCWLLLSSEFIKKNRILFIQSCTGRVAD